MIINLTPLGKPFYKLSNIQYSTDGNTWNTLSNSNVSDNSNYETYYVNNKGWMLVIKKNLYLRFNKTLNKNITTFLVGGGGGGGRGNNTTTGHSERQGGGGGGAGGECKKNTTTFFDGTYFITIGSGGIGGTNGTNSIIKQNNLNILTAAGGNKGNDHTESGMPPDGIVVGGVGGSGSFGGGSGGNGGVYETNATNGSNGTLFNVSFLPAENKWNNVYYGSGGGGGSGGTWAFLHKKYDSNNNFIGYQGEATYDLKEPGNGGADSGGKGGGKITARSTSYEDRNGGYISYYWLVDIPKSNESLYQAQNGSTNYGGGGGGGGCAGIDLCAYTTGTSQYGETNAPINGWDGASENRAGANGGSGVCILCYGE